MRPKHEKYKNENENLDRQELILSSQPSKGPGYPEHACPSFFQKTRTTAASGFSTGHSHSPSSYYASASAAAVAAASQQVPSVRGPSSYYARYSASGIVLISPSRCHLLPSAAGVPAAPMHLSGIRLRPRSLAVGLRVLVSACALNLRVPVLRMIQRALLGRSLRDLSVLLVARACVLVYGVVPGVSL